MMSMSLLAQEKKAFTLEDVIPGGSNYYNLVPKNMSGLNGGAMYVSAPM